MLFCPTCSNLLLLEKSGNSFRYFCKTCPYVFNVTQKIKIIENFEHKDEDLILGGKEAWENVSKTNAVCPKCEHPKAYFKEIQIRSADEPTTIFYKCAECGYEWREG
ncbi:MAG: transcription factor S [archaeon]|nr:transcription factor S [archaeon]